MDYESQLNRAFDLVADDRQNDAEELVEECIDHIKNHLDHGPGDAHRYFYWGLALLAIDEPEQALLRFEKALEIEPDNREFLWQTVSILLYDFQNASAANSILEKRLLPLEPDNEKYRDACNASRMMLKGEAMEAARNQILEGGTNHADSDPEDSSEPEPPPAEAPAEEDTDLNDPRR